MHHFLLFDIIDLKYKMRERVGASEERVSEEEDHLVTLISP